MSLHWLNQSCFFDIWFSVILPVATASAAGLAREPRFLRAVSGEILSELSQNLSCRSLCLKEAFSGWKSSHLMGTISRWTVVGWFYSCWEEDCKRTRSGALWGPFWGLGWGRGDALSDAALSKSAVSGPWLAAAHYCLFPSTKLTSFIIIASYDFCHIEAASRRKNRKKNGNKRSKENCWTGKRFQSF